MVDLLGSLLISLWGSMRYAMLLNEICIVKLNLKITITKI